MTAKVRRITTVFVTYQSARTIGAALEAARAAYDAEISDCVVVDNRSTDGTIEILRRHASWAKIIETGQNLGFGRGCNRGLAESTTEYTLFLNPDARMSPDALVALAAFLDENDRVGIVGPAIIEGEDHAKPALQITGRRPTPTSILLAQLPSRTAPHGNRPIQPGGAPFRTEWVCGAALMGRTELLKQLGGFDPRFFLYWEETDLCRRAETAGTEIWAVGEAVAHHIGGASSAPDPSRIGGCIAKFYYESRFHYLTKHHGYLAAVATDLMEYALLISRAAIDCLRGRGTGRLLPRRQAKLLTAPKVV